MRRIISKIVSSRMNSLINKGLVHRNKSDVKGMQMKFGTRDQAMVFFVASSMTICNVIRRPWITKKRNWDIEVLASITFMRIISWKREEKRNVELIATH